MSPTLAIALGELRWRVSPPGGPGGQHANKTSSRVEVTFDIANSPSLGPRQRARLLERLGPVARASSAQDRSQSRNRQIALGRLADRLGAALRVDPPRRPTRRTAGSTERRLEEKRRRSSTKQRRSEGIDLD
ncbi:MAG TPA: alternative ribosome rescue aminoacyl-tRNA hydrolase ArfB [Acidimicrobiales bacterium]